MYGVTELDMQAAWDELREMPHDTDGPNGDCRCCLEVGDVVAGTLTQIIGSNPLFAQLSIALGFSEHMAMMIKAACQVGIIAHAKAASRQADLAELAKLERS